MDWLRPIALLLAVAAGTACASPASRSGPERPAAMQSYVWYDGDQPRRVWLDPDLIAEFAPPDREMAPAARHGPPARDAVELPSPQRGVRLWRVPGDGASAARSLQLERPQAKVSPVLRDAPSADAPMRALPGNVIVHLDPALDEVEVREWFASRGLTPVRRLGVGRNVYLVASEPGLAALELANRLRGDAAVNAAAPDWWEQVEPR